MDMKSGTGEVDMGMKGKMGFKIDMPKPGTTPDPSAMAFHLDGKEMTMAGLVERRVAGPRAQRASRLGGDRDQVWMALRERENRGSR